MNAEEILITEKHKKKSLYHKNVYFVNRRIEML